MPDLAEQNLISSSRKALIAIADAYFVIQRKPICFVYRYDEYHNLSSRRFISP
ncbi:hypothetical protein FM107_17435 [Sphingobacterium sp. JB170]|nr:hypothetical protein FM107_17435 [Sphingobacterium sp. JB170]